MVYKNIFKKPLPQHVHQNSELSIHKTQLSKLDQEFAALLSEINALSQTFQESRNPFVETDRLVRTVIADYEYYMIQKNEIIEEKDRKVRELFDENGEQFVKQLKVQKIKDQIAFTKEATEELQSIVTDLRALVSNPAIEQATLKRNDAIHFKKMRIQEALIGLKPQDSMIEKYSPYLEIDHKKTQILSAWAQDTATQFYQHNDQEISSQFNEVLLRIDAHKNFMASEYKRVDNYLEKRSIWVAEIDFLRKRRFKPGACDLELEIIDSTINSLQSDFKKFSMKKSSIFIVK